MISLIEDLPTDQNRNSINVSYLRSVNIIFGNYSFPDILNNFLIKIKNNLDPELENYTNVKGGMTDWNYFVDDPDFIKFISFLINKYQITHPGIFKYFLTRKTITQAWGNEIKKGDSLNYHTHPCYHGILYLTKGCDLILPELNIKISPKPGDYYVFPPEILHGFEKYKDDDTRYSLIFNIGDKNNEFKFKNYTK
tara:strand:- start:356 stop:940 length:585 start_codon:yes stop_codon:yes gene_type:complete